MPKNGESSNINFTSYRLQRIVHFANWHGDQVGCCRFSY
jgi:hypothetical protein